MTRRLLLLTEIISPYRIPLFNALARHENVDLHVIFLAETDPNLRQWQVYKDEIKFSYQVLPSWRRRLGKYNVLLNRGLGQALAAAAPDVILCGGYSYIASWQALLWARSRSVPFLLWSESNRQDLRRGHALVEFLKAEFVQRCDAFVVPGRSAREYLRSQKIKETSIFTAPNAVDNDFFGSAAAMVRREASDRRRELGLPDRYFLFVGRLVAEKGVFDLLSAYAKLDNEVRQRTGLVFVGDGVSQRKLEEQAASISPGRVIFSGFAQREQLAEYYAFAQALILPTYTDTWGLVVNEAMACALTAILSRAAGCAADLVKEHWNGLLIPPKDVAALTEAMTSLANHPELCVTMGANAVQHISHYSPAEWATGVARAVEITAGVRA
ncbi:MAG: glycosyltransferase family 4 protein [Candidatus Sulfotelmatobacter sp.]